MPMSTTLLAVSPATLRSLEASPNSIHEVESQRIFNTYLWTTIPYFLTDGQDDDGDEDEDEDREGAHPLSPVLDGVRSVSCARLENGAFYVVPAEDVAKLSTQLAAVDHAQIRRAVLEADLEEILDGEVWEELEQLDLSEPEEVAASLLVDLQSLTAFYAKASSAGLAIVGYTT